LTVEASATIDTTATSEPVLVLGDARLLAHSIGRVLESSGFSVLAADARTRPAVAVLVEPLGVHWRRRDELDVPAIVLTSMEPDADDLTQFVLGGAEAILPVDCEREQLVGTVRRVVAGESALTRAQSQMLLDGIRRRISRDAPPDIHLTPRELEILQTIDRGMSVKQTARVLSISPRTVENTQRVLYRKLGVRNRAQAVARAYELGLFTREPS
jgi:DNA-binding NarL/FixJ family response regulator